MGKVFAYARVSTPRQGEKGVSLIEQRDAITRYADRYGLHIVRWFEEQESASKKGRPAFNQMLRLLRLGNAQGVIIHKIDRSARNLEDWNDIGRLADAGVEVYFATESIDLKTTAGRLSADIQAVVATHYSRNLREEVKKGIYGRLKQGFYPFRAPIGYLDQGSAKPKIFDLTRAPLIKTAFELYASGEYSLPSLTKEFFGRGLRNLRGGRVSMNGWATILKNPFYIGLMRIVKNGETFKGAHEPLISVPLFEQAQRVLSGKRVDRTENQIFTYSRIARCATCKYSLIAECQKGHIYYRCHNRPFKVPAVCPATSVREEELDAQVLAVVANIQLSDEELHSAQEFMKRERAAIEEQHLAAKNALRLQGDNIAKRISSLMDLLVDGTIEKSLFQTKHAELLREQAAIDEKLRGVKEHNVAVTQQLARAVELAKDASLLYRSASVENKRRLLKILLSNLIVSGKKIEIMLSTPFQLIAERGKTDDGRPYRGSCRTWDEALGSLLRHFKRYPDGVSWDPPT